MLAALNQACGDVIKISSCSQCGDHLATSNGVSIAPILSCLMRCKPLHVDFLGTRSLLAVVLSQCSYNH